MASLAYTMFPLLLARDVILGVRNRASRFSLYFANVSKVVSTCYDKRLATFMADVPQQKVAV